MKITNKLNPQFETLDGRIMMTADLACSEKAEASTAETAPEKGRESDEDRSAAELEESGSADSFDEATIEQMSSMAVSVLFGIDETQSETERDLESMMAGVIGQVAEAVNAPADYGDTILPMENLIHDLVKNDHVNVMADALRSLGDSGGLSPSSNDWLSPTAGTQAIASKALGDTGLWAGVTDATTAAKAPALGVIGTAVGVADVAVRVANDAQDGHARLGTGVAIVATLTGAGTGALIGGPVGAVIGAVVGLVGWFVGDAADAADAAVEKGETETPSSDKVDTGSSKAADKKDADEGSKNEKQDAPSTPKDGPTFEEQLRFRNWLLATSPAFRETMRWIQNAKARGDIDPPPSELSDLGDTTMSDTSSREGLVNPGTEDNSTLSGGQGIPASQGGDIDFGPDANQTYDANHRPGESEVPGSVGRTDDTVSLPASDDNNNNVVSHTGKNV